MTVDMEQNGEAARIRKSPQYETAVNEIICGADPEEVYTNAEGERFTEYDIVARAMSRGGAAWLCIDRSCRCINLQSSKSCDNCGRRRPAPKSVPKADCTI